MQESKRITVIFQKWKIFQMNVIKTHSASQTNQYAHCKTNSKEEEVDISEKPCGQQNRKKFQRPR
jgi:hypothetical protein